MTVTAAHRKRLDIYSEKAQNARSKRARLQKQLGAAEEAGDEDAQATIERQLQDVHVEIETADQLKQLELHGIANVNVPAGSPLVNSVESRELLRGVANTSNDLRHDMVAGELVSHEQAVELTGSAIHAAVTIPDTVIPTSFPSGIVTPPQAPLTLLDFFGTVLSDARVVTYMRRLGGIANAAVTAPGAIKPEANVVYEPVDVEHEQVATYTKVNRVDVDDIDGFMADLQLFMRYGILHEVQELLVTALTTTSGIVVPDVSADGNTPDKLLSAVGQLTASGVQPNFVALSPLDATAAFKEREAAEGAYIAGSPWDKLPPIVQSAALAPGTALTGDSRVAAALSVRQGVVVIIGTEAEDLRRNLLTVVLEGRWAPLVLVPAALAKVDLTTA